MPLLNANRDTTLNSDNRLFMPSDQKLVHPTPLNPPLNHIWVPLVPVSLPPPRTTLISRPPFNLSKRNKSPYGLISNLSMLSSVILFRSSVMSSVVWLIPKTNIFKTLGLV